MLSDKAFLQSVETIQHSSLNRPYANRLKSSFVDGARARRKIVLTSTFLINRVSLRAEAEQVLALDDHLELLIKPCAM